ncbi:MAG TPA: AraC family transcriptional regulator [Polyangiaceae bacterium]|nr:AraC family transcriptional regulator [Polyangiaceae bacterium]
MRGGGPASLDVLSDVLEGVRLNAALFFCVEASSPWVAEAPPGAAIAPLILPEAQHVVSYHVLLDGSCYCEFAEGPPVKLEAGDIVIIPHGDRYALSSRPGMLGSYPEAELCEWFRQAVARAVPDPFNFSEGGGGAETRRVLCGFLGCDMAPFNPVLAQLPRLLHIRALAGDADARFRHLTDLALLEVRERRPGRESVLLRVSELLFVEAIRQHLAALPAGAESWLAGLRDPLVGRALILLHERPAQPWTVEELAQRSGASRSVLAERFSQLVGKPPMQYLMEWRMQLAARRLCDARTKVAAVALEVGYDSEAAFSRAFKAIVGVPPATWRLERARHAAAPAR